MSRVCSPGLVPPPSIVAVDSPTLPGSGGGGLYNITHQRTSHDFPTYCVDDLEVIGLRRLTGSSDMDRSTTAQSPAQEKSNTSTDFEWDFGEDNNNSPAVRRLDHLVKHRQVIARSIPLPSSPAMADC